MRVLIALLVGVAFAHGLAQGPMVKTGPGGSSVIEVVCDDAMRRLDAVTRAELERRFRSDIVVRCRASASVGFGRIAAREFSYRSRYAADERVHNLRQGDFHGQLGEVYGGTVLEFFIGLPNFSRPWVIELYFGDGATEIVFVRNP